ncbi:MAG: ABC transporter permease, partial [Propionibacteriaceae bacterium]
MTAPTSSRTKNLGQAVYKHRLFWPAAVLVLLLVSNVFFSPSFFTVRLQDGHLYGSLIDVLRSATPLALVALGMTMVIATGGIDLSVGSVVAIAGALACLQISQDAGVFTAVVLALGLSV